MDSSSKPLYSVLSPSPSSSQTNIFVGLIIDAVLDEDVLTAKAEELIQRWPSLGGTVVTKNTIPHSLTMAGPLNFASRHMDENLSTIFPFDISFENKDDQPEIRSAKLSTSNESLFHWGGSVRVLHASADTLLALRITILRDATLLGFRTSHHFVDADSTFTIVKAYCSLINNEDIPELTLPPDVITPMSTLVCQEEKAYPLANIESQPLPPPSELYPLGLFKLLRWAVPIMLQTLLQKYNIIERFEEKYVHLSGNFVDNLRREYQEELDKASSDGLLERGAGLQISRNDVITSWFAKKAYKHITSATGPIYVFSPLDYRSVIEPPPTGTTYLHCSILNFFADIGIFDELQTASAALVALKIRLAVLQSKQPSAIKRALEYMEENWTLPMAPSPPAARYDNTFFSFSYTNQGYTGLDFSKAIKVDSAADKMAKGDLEGRGKVVFWTPAVYAPFGLCPSPHIMNTKDGKGGYWIRVLNWKSTWKWFDEE